MSKKLNLAMLNKRKEELSEKEMKNVFTGVDPNPDEDDECSCESLIVKTDCWETDQYRNCKCASIWVVFGLTWG